MLMLPSGAAAPYHGSMVAMVFCRDSLAIYLAAPGGLRLQMTGDDGQRPQPFAWLRTLIA